MLRMLAFLAALAPAAAGAQTLRTEDLIGRWGVAAYWNDSDAAKITGMARGFCSQPYVVTRGANGAARMFEAFEGRPQDVTVQGGRIVAVSGSERTAKPSSAGTARRCLQLRRRGSEAEIRQHGLRALRAVIVRRSAPPPARGGREGATASQDQAPR